METLNELLDKQIELLTDQRSTLIYAITEADENSPNYSVKVDALSKQISDTDYRIDILMQRIASDVQVETKEGIQNLNIKMPIDTFNYAGVDYLRDSVIEGINEASENPTTKDSDSDANLQIRINKLTHAGLKIFESKLIKAK